MQNGGFATANDSTPTQGPSAGILAVVLGILSVFVVVARFWARRVLQKGNVDIDDWLLVAAMPFFIAQLVVAILLTTAYGFDRHMKDNSMENKILQEKLLLAHSPTYIVGSTLVKVSILCFYRRFARREINKYFLYCIWGMIAIDLGTALPAIIILLAECRPIDSFWMQYDPAWTATHTYHCLPRVALWPFASTMGALQDLASTLLPLPVVWGTVSRNRTQKVFTLGLFASGIMLAGTALLRAWIVCKMWGTQNDISWWGYYYCLISTIEVSFGIIFCSLPALRAYFDKDRDPRLNFLGLRRRHRSAAETEAAWGRRVLKDSAYGSGTGVTSRSTPRGSNISQSPDSSALDLPLDSGSSVISASDRTLREPRKDVEGNSTITQLELGWELEEGVGSGKLSLEPWPWERSETSIAEQKLALSIARAKDAEHCRDTVPP